MLHYVQEELGEELSSGRLSILRDSGPLFGLLGKRFPIGLNRIAWERVKEKQLIEVLPEPRQIASHELRALLAEHQATVRQWLEDEGVSKDARVIWLGDMTDAALEMSRDDLVEFFPVLFSFPQHSYVLPRDGCWCLNYVMEGELFFGRAPETTVNKPSRRKPRESDV